MAEDRNINDILKFMESVNISPDKTEIIRVRNSIKIKHKGRKGYVKFRKQCKSCARVGIYQAGLGMAFSFCCEREDGWRAMSGDTTTKCKFFKEKDEEMEKDDTNV